MKEIAGLAVDKISKLGGWILECKLVIWLAGNIAEEVNTIFSQKDCFVSAAECD
jgi:hypothetical protein